jgi:hypothetical protein
MYQYQHIRTDLNDSLDVTHALLLSYTLNATPAISLSFFAGPQQSESSNLLSPSVTKWVPAGGATFTWQSLHSAFSAGVSHKISDGGGLPGAVQLTSVDASYRRQFAHRWEIRTGISYGKDDLVIMTVPSATNSRSVVAVVGISHQIGEHLTVAASYVRAYQQYLDGIGGSSDFNRNRPQISLSYTFSRPLGR